ncbi:hypothetical protein [Sphingobacterium sp. DR205]|uniref:hypothetical protein n=1 Tax=Sphingobacterium sp. DR205 TaxID=2713573 RepID=UPI0013E518F4|nr:hypothetical protein [Sphingobacterium sp. DR205]QIH34959.1 hypothetical protein G6053_19575 [Sphingobacterium sp. DR205]
MIIYTHKPCTGGTCMAQSPHERERLDRVEPSRTETVSRATAVLRSDLIMLWLVTVVTAVLSVVVQRYPADFYQQAATVAQKPSCICSGSTVIPNKTCCRKQHVYSL